MAAPPLIIVTLYHERVTKSNSHSAEICYDFIVKTSMRKDVFYENYLYGCGQYRIFEKCVR
jgi:hypothetical protein